MTEGRRCQVGKLIFAFFGIIILVTRRAMPILFSSFIKTRRQNSFVMRHIMSKLWDFFICIIITTISITILISLISRFKTSCDSLVNIHYIMFKIRNNMFTENIVTTRTCSMRCVSVRIASGVKTFNLYHIMPGRINGYIYNFVNSIRRIEILLTF